MGDAEFDEDPERRVSWAGESEKAEKERLDRIASDSSSPETSSPEISPSRPAPKDVEAKPTDEYSEDPIPDGGLRAWLQVLSGFMLYLNSW